MSVSGWSFCIVTAPGNDQVLTQSIRSIDLENKASNYEIIVVGAVSDEIRRANPSVVFTTVKERYLNIRNPRPKIKKFLRAPSWGALVDIFYKYGPISHKKNHAARLARFDKLCIMHDYVALEPGWNGGYKTFGDNWEVCMNVVKNNDGSRFRDWCAWDYKDVGPGLLPYHAKIREMYISGTYFCVKRDFFLSNPLNQSLFWGEGEDVEWSLRVRQLTQFEMNTQSSVRFLKMKPKDQAPYDNQWRENQRRLEQEFS